MNAPARTSAYEEGLSLAARGQHAPAIACFERALAQSPDDSRVLFALGNTARALGLARPAEAFFRRVLAQDPDRLEALVNLANLLRAEGNFAAAEALLLPALARAPAAAELWLTLGSIYRESGRSEQAKAHYLQALANRPGYVQALGNLADLVADDGNVEEALALYDRVLAGEPKNAQARLNRAMIHLARGDLKNGWRDYAARLSIPGKVPGATHKLARWSGGTLARQRLLVTAEQGIGDQIMFASVVPDLASRAREQGGSVILECEPRLAPLFGRSFPAVMVRGWDAETRGGVTTMNHAWLKAAGGATCAIEMGTLPRHFRKSLESFPARGSYLVPDGEEISRWRARIPAQSIGICWRSGMTGGHRALQYAPLETWAAFIRAWPGPVVCLQYDAAPDEVARLEALSGKAVFVPEGINQKSELDRVAALLAALAAVVSAPTAVSWLAAAMGVPTFKVLYDISWTSFGEGFEPFAPSCRCISPAVPGDWPDCFAKALQALKAQLSRA